MTNPNDAHMPNLNATATKSSNEEREVAAVVAAWRESEIRISSFIKSGNARWTEFIERSDASRDREALMDVDYYKSVHNNDGAYKSNNWLLDELDKFVGNKYGTVVELGAGNCRFSFRISQQSDSVYAMDWALSPQKETPANVKLLECDITDTTIPKADLLCSGDFLEHIAEDKLFPLITRISASSFTQFHIIACYDDGHSHLTIMPPGAWLGLFKLVSPAFELTSVKCRRFDPRQVVCTIERRLP